MFAKSLNQRTYARAIDFDVEDGTVAVIPMLPISEITINLSSDSFSMGSSVTISGPIDPIRPDVNVIIEYRPSGGTWSTLATTTTDQNSNYEYTWKPETAGTYEIRAKWDGDENTEGDVSDTKTLTVTKAAGIDPVLLAGVVVAIIIIIAIVVYFVRKPKE